MGEVRQVEKIVLADGNVTVAGTVVLEVGWLSFCPNAANKPTRIYPWQFVRELHLK